MSADLKRLKTENRAGESTNLDSSHIVILIFQNGLTPQLIPNPGLLSAAVCARCCSLVIVRRRRVCVSSSGVILLQEVLPVVRPVLKDIRGNQEGLRDSRQRQQRLHRRVRTQVCKTVTHRVKVYDLLAVTNTDSLFN